MNSRDQTRRKQILTGNIWKIVFSIAFPLFTYRFLFSFYNLIDQIMAAEIGNDAVSAVTQINLIKTFISCISNGIAGGAGVYLALKFGEGKINEAKKINNVTFTILLIFSGIVLLLVPFSSGILQLANIAPEIIKISSLPFSLQLIEQVIIAVNSLFIVQERSKGNTKIILYLNIGIMVIKIAFNALFIYVFKVDSILYLEIASILAQLSMFSFAVYKLFTKKNIFQLSFKELSLEKSYVKQIFKYSVPLIIGASIVDLGKIIFNSFCKVYGSLTIGALGVSNTVTGLASNPSSCIQDAESSIISTNLGNKNMKRTVKTFGVSLVYMLVWLTFSFLIIRVFFMDEIISLFNTKNTTPEFVEMVKNIIVYDCWSIPTIMVCNICLGFLIGYGKTFISIIINAIRMTFRIGSIIILQNFFPEIGGEALGISMAISNTSIMIVAVITIVFFILRLKKKGFKGLHFSDPEPEYTPIENEN